MSLSSLFISYSRKNIQVAERLHTDLERAGLKVWRDLRDLAIGEEWRAVIRTQIQSHDKFLLLASPESNASEFVQEELMLAKSGSGRPSIGYAIVAGSYQEMSDQWRILDGADLRKSYKNGLAKICSWLGVVGQPDDFYDLMKLGYSIKEIQETLQARRNWTVNGRKFIALPIGVSGYTSSWLIMNEESPLIIPRDVQVLLKFSGQASRDTAIELLNYLDANDVQPCIVYVEGPRSEMHDFVIPNDRRHMWADCITAAVNVIQQIANSKELHIFCDAPSVLVYPIGAKLREMSPYQVYNLNRDSKDAKSRYECVFQHP